MNDRHFDGRNQAGNDRFAGNGMDQDTSMMVFSGNANLPLAEEVVARLNIPLGKARVGRFSDGEVMVEIDDSVRGKDVFIVQSTCSPVDRNLMELLVMIDGKGTLTPFFEFVTSPFHQKNLRFLKAAKLSLFFALIRVLPRAQAFGLARYLLEKRR